jgi:hypothetical protein
MAPELALRISDTILALFWAWLLLISLRVGRLGGESGLQTSRQERPGAYWFGIFIIVLMLIHFAGLAWVGQKVS